MTIRNELMTFLGTSEVVNNINFSINGIQVNQTLFQSVIREVNAYRVYVLVNPNLRNHTAQRNQLTGGQISSGADAQYAANGNSFTFTTNTFGDEHAKALALHEAIHAAFDINRVSMWAIDDEAAAYIAQCIYLQVKGIPVTVNTPTFNAAVAAARSIMSRSGLTPPLLQQLRTALQSNPLYREIAAPNSRYRRDG